MRVSLGLSLFCPPPHPPGVTFPLSLPPHTIAHHPTSVFFAGTLPQPAFLPPPSSSHAQLPLHPHPTFLGVGMDVQEAARLYSLAMAQGNIVAGYNLGKLYEKGEGVPANPARAAQLYLSAASEVG